MRLGPRKPGKAGPPLGSSIDSPTCLSLVSDRSINTLKRRALRRSKTLGRDAETQEAIYPSRISQFSQKLKAPFTRDFWEDKLEQSDDETLVDGKLLSYAYLEAGMIEMLGS